MNITIRELSNKDHEEAIAVIKKSISISMGEIYPQPLIDEFCKKYTSEKFAEKAKEVAYFIAEDTDNKKIVGIIGLKNNELRTFFVDPEYQGNGIGKRLYEHLETKAKNNGIKQLILQGSPLGQPVYEKLGFKKIRSITKERIGIPYIDAYMEKNLH